MADESSWLLLLKNSGADRLSTDLDGNKFKTMVQKFRFNLSHQTLFDQTGWGEKFYFFFFFFTSNVIKNFYYL